MPTASPPRPRPERSPDVVPGRLEAEVATYLDHLAVERGIARNTLDSYRRDLRRYTAHLHARGVHALAQAHESDVAEFVAVLQVGDPAHDVAPLARTSAARALVAARGLHRFALLDGIVEVDVAHQVRPPTPARRLPKALAVDDVLALLEASGGTAEHAGPRELRDRALLELLYSTGARISEAVGLDVDDVDTTTRSVLLDGKGGKQRLVPVGRPALAALDAWLVRGRPALLSRGTPAVFLNARGGRLSRQSAWQVLARAGERAGLHAAVSPHTLRHSFATHLLDGGADIRVVQELLGHASVTTTQVYTLVTVEGLREVWAGAHPRAR